jgi:hypothetical protein
VRAGPKAAVDGSPLHTLRRIDLAVAAVMAHSLATWLAGGGSSNCFTFDHDDCFGALRISASLKVRVPSSAVSAPLRVTPRRRLQTGNLHKAEKEAERMKRAIVAAVAQGGSPPASGRTSTRFTGQSGDRGASPNLAAHR